MEKFQQWEVAKNVYAHTHTFVYLLAVYGTHVRATLLIVWNNSELME